MSLEDLENMTFSRERIRKAFEKLIDIFNELSEQDCTEAEIILAIHLALDARLLSAFKLNKED